MSLSVKPVSGILDNQTDAIGKSDPYVVLILGQQKKKGKPSNGAGKKPTWTEVFNFNAKETLLNVEVWDKDTFTADDFLGSGQYDLKKVYSSPNTPFNEYINLAIKGKPSGQYTGPAIGQQGGQQGQQGNWGQQGQQGQQGGWGQQGQQGGQGAWGQQGQQQGQQGQQGGWGQQGQQQGGQQGGWGQQGQQQGQQGQQGGWGQQGQQGGQGNWGQQGQQGGQGGSGGFVL